MSSEKQAIVLAAFGAAHLNALSEIMNIKHKAAAAFPSVPVHLSFTSRIIRRVWRKRRTDGEWRKQNPSVPDEIIEIKSPLATIADLQDQGYRTIIVQPLHLYAGEEYLNLKSYIDALNSIQTVKPKHQPFEKLVLGRPALGEPGVRHSYRDDIRTAVQAVQDDVAGVRTDGSILVYMGHGNNFMSSGIYLEFQEVMRQAHPGLRIFVGVLEGFPGLDYVVTRLKHVKADRVTLIPFLLGAGEHALNDMAGDDDESWKTILEQNGFHVSCVLRGLGALDSWADIYVRHIRDVMEDHLIS